MYYFKLIEVKNKGNTKYKWRYFKTYLHVLPESHVNWYTIFGEQFGYFYETGKKRILYIDRVILIFCWRIIRYILIARNK